MVDETVSAPGDEEKEEKEEEPGVQVVSIGNDNAAVDSTRVGLDTVPILSLGAEEVITSR